MYDLVQAVLHSDEKTALQQLVHELSASGKQYFLRNEILQAFEDYCHKFEKPAYFYHSSTLGELIHYTHEILLEEECIWFLFRSQIASQEICRLAADLSQVERMTTEELLHLRDRSVNREQPKILEIDFGPFQDTAAAISDPRNIGNGLEALNRYLVSTIPDHRQYWLDALFDAMKQHHYNDISLLVGDRIHSAEQFTQHIKQAIRLLGEHASDQPYEQVHPHLQELGFEPGWGDTAGRARETLELLDRIIANPDAAVLEAFVARIPTIFRVVSISIHGWVSQENVLGRPETAGQVVYVLDQARSLENRLREDIQLAGLAHFGIQPQVVVVTRLIPNCEGTYCAQRLEKIEGTENAWILRVPFRDFNPKITQNWISRYEIWPYLESFAEDAEKALLEHLGGNPELVIGNYSDGNLVAFLLARRLKASQCSIAHSLEKSKHLFSDLYWENLEDQYHFSLQFTADLISMNAADFIITSSHQEILGTPDMAGQYESYKYFTMPHLYHVVNGIELFSPKFNVVPPGVNESIFFPHHQTEDRDPEIRDRVKTLLLVQEDSRILGQLEDLNKRPLFALGPITSAKNLADLIECFGTHSELQERCNLILLTSTLDTAQATTPEERREIERLHELINQHKLHGKMRWLGMRLPGRDLGEAYRIIADLGGMFILPARFEAFGLPVLEAMISGLPTFATQFGGPSEIIQDGENGFLINPTDLAGIAKRIVDFVDQCNVHADHWHHISERAIERVRSRYSWQLHTKQMLLFTKIDTFWSHHVPQTNREALRRYLDALFYLIYKPKAEQLLEQHMQR